MMGGGKSDKPQYFNKDSVDPYYWSVELTYTLDDGTEVGTSRTYFKTYSVQEGGWFSDTKVTGQIYKQQGDKEPKPVGVEITITPEQNQANFGEEKKKADKKADNQNYIKEKADQEAADARVAGANAAAQAAAKEAADRAAAIASATVSAVAPLLNKNPGSESADSGRCQNTAEQIAACMGWGNTGEDEDNECSHGGLASQVSSNNIGSANAQDTACWCSLQAKKQKDFAATGTGDMPGTASDFCKGIKGTPLILQTYITDPAPMMKKQINNFSAPAKFNANQRPVNMQKSTGSQLPAIKGTTGNTNINKGKR